MPITVRDHLETVSRAEEKRVNTLFGISLIVCLFVWVEIERRLGVLNHAHEKAVEVQHTYVTKDVYDQDKDNRDEKIGGVEKALLALRTTRATTIAVMTIGCSVIAVIVLLANGVI